MVCDNFAEVRSRSRLPRLTRWSRKTQTGGGKSRVKSLTVLFKIILCVLVVFFAVVLLIVLHAQQLHGDTVKSQERRHRSYKLAEELRQSSDDLTRMARSYVCSNDKQYLAYYHEILAIRNGTQPRPANYPTTYWYLYPAGSMNSRPGPAISLETLLRNEGFSNNELTLLQTSQQRSDRLVDIEEEAFNAMEGKFQDGKGNYTVSRAPDPERAHNLLYSAEYHAAKVGIMEPIDRFLKEVDARTSLELDRFQKQELRHIRITIALLGAFIVIVPFMGILVRRQILIPLNRLVERAKEVAQGNYSSDSEVQGIEEFSVLSKGFNEMSTAIEHEVTELKKLQDALSSSELNLKRAQEIAKFGSWHIDSMEIMHFSDQAHGILHLPAGRSLDYDSFMNIVHPEDRNPLRAAWQAATKGHRLDIEHRIIASGAIKWLHSRGEFKTDDSAKIESGVGTIQDITERKQVEMRDKGRRYILELIANGTDLHIVLDTLINNLEDELTEAIGCVMMASRSGRSLSLAAAPSLDSNLVIALDGLLIEPGSACCGTAAFTGESVIVEDVRTHPNFTGLRDAIRDAEVKACWSYPIMSATNDVLGTLAVYHKRFCSPSGDEQRIVNSYAHLAGIALSSANLAFQSSPLRHAIR